MPGRLHLAGWSDALQRIAPYLLLTICGLAPLSWLREGYPIKGVDSYFSMHPQGIGLLSLDPWVSRASTGVPTSNVVAWSVNGVQAGLREIGLPLVTIEGILLTGLSLSALFGMHRLANTLLEAWNVGPVRPRASALSQRHRSWIAAAVAIAWLANPFALSFVWFHQLLTEVSWAALPWLIELLVRVV